jgi:hypothetical protein
MDRHASIDGEMWIVESADSGKVVAKIRFAQMAGDYKSAEDFDITRRIASAYSTAGKKLGYYLGSKTD